MSEIEPVTERDIDEVLNARAAGYDIRYALEQDRRRVAQRQAERPLEKINCDESYGRSYIPVAPGWEVQTKGKGSTFRLCEPSGDRLAVPDSPYLHATIERMALAIHAHRVAMEEEIERLRAEVAAHRKHDVLRCDALMKAEAEVAKLNAACAAKDEAICTLRDHITVGMYRAVPHLADVAASALSDDAGTNWIDASGAVEAEASRHVVLGNTWLKDGGVLLPGDWAGSKVKIVQVQP